MAEQKLRIGFVGAGNIVRTRHAPGLGKIEGVEFAAVVNSRPETTAAAAEEYGIRKTFDHWSELVGWDGIDVVWIGTHPNLHRPVTEAALAAGKHVFCQARLAPSYEDAKAMVEAARRSDRTTMVCAAPHYMRGDRTVLRLLREGVVGQPYHAVIRSFSDTYADPAKPLHWRQVKSISGVNTLDLGMMIEVQQRWLGYARRVTALAATFTPTRPDAAGGRAPVERPDTFTAVAELESGALATYILSGVARHATETNSFEIFGSEGTIRYLYATNIILAGRAGDAELREVPIPPEEAREWTVEQDFVDAVRAGRRSTYPSFWDGLKYIEMTEAIFRSAETGRAVDLPFERIEAPE
jgi:predicted dehydrogenase